VPEESGAAGSSGQGAPRSPERARQQDSAGAIYGSMAAAAVIAASGRHLPPGQVLALTLSTLLTFWLAHVYARVLAHHLQAATGLRWDIVVAAMVEEWPMVAAPAPALAVLLLGAVGVLEEHLAVNLALWVGVAQLVGWGIAYARRQRWGWPIALATGAINGTFGVVIIGLKAFVH
jgi:hypothetical protein